MMILTRPLMGVVGTLAIAALMPGSVLAQGDVVFIGTSMFGEYEVGSEGAGEDAVGDFSAELDIKAGRMC
ncbi:MAG: hypothetical protein AAF941_00950 [Pseudomonadota bacterium]